MNVRIGAVSSVDTINRTARVSFADKPSENGRPLVSAPLAIMQNPPVISSISVQPWLPKVGQTVLCIFLPNGEGDGVIIGGL
ncbi:MAG: hypothetical protein FWD48_01235 [Oscillospiraceae bacterium]|nr:hypothetical protein [Oscillospiraceae bacterium]